MNLSDLKAQFVALANRRDLTANTTLQQTFINQGVMRIQRELRCPAMEKSVIVTIGDGYTGLVIPNDLLELQYILPLKDPDDAEKLIKTDITTATQGAQISAGIPRVYCRDAAVWILAPSPVSGDQIKLVYWAELTPLVNPTDTNIISIIAWDLIVYAALVQMAIYFKDVRKGDFEDQYQTILGDLQEQSDEDDENGSAVVEPCYEFPLDWPFEHF